MLKAVIFDLDDTLYDYTSLHMGAVKALEAYTCARYGITGETFCALLAAAKEDTKRALAGTAASHNRLLYCQKLLEYLDAPPAVDALEMYEAYWGYILEHIKLRDGAAELLAACKRRAVKIGICSDLTAHIQHRKLRALGIAPLIDGVVTSEEAGAEKPDARMFAMILEKLHCRPEETLFIGDSLERDVCGAERHGIPAVWFGGCGRDNAVATFEEVRTLLKWE